METIETVFHVPLPPCKQEIGQDLVDLGPLGRITRFTGNHYPIIILYYIYFSNIFS